MLKKRAYTPVRRMRLARILWDVVDRVEQWWKRAVAIANAMQVIVVF